MREGIERDREWEEEGEGKRRERGRDIHAHTVCMHMCNLSTPTTQHTQSTRTSCSFPGWSVLAGVNEYKRPVAR